MDLAEAQRIIDCLCRGVNPFSDEALDYHEICSDETVQVALQKVSQQLKNVGLVSKREKRNNIWKKARQRAVNSGKSWSPEADALLLSMYEEGTEKEKLCQYFGRTENAIAARLVHLGRISRRTEFYD